MQSISSIQSLRFIAAAAVVFYHAGILVLDHSDIAWPGPYYLASRAGAAGVHVFFVISGFVMYHTARNKFGDAAECGRFLLRRLLRIYPTYWIAAAIYLAAFAIWPSVGNVEGSLFHALILWPGEASAVIEPAWTLTFEMYFYVAFGLALLFPKQLGLSLLFGLFTLSVIFGQIVNPVSPVARDITSILLLEFLAGTLLGISYHNGLLARLVSSKWTANLGLFLSLILLVAGPYLRFVDLPQVLFWGPASVLLVGCCLAAEQQGNNPSWMSRIAWLGDSSYALYLLHILFVWLFVVWAASWVTNLLLFSIWIVGSILICTLIAIAFNLWIEVPILRALRRRLRV